ncbi:unnamed protein product [Mytilus coruscus]|uniref:DUF3504 domain-containing protein n=1 Tax=Mytilus coruscus TaxID=42192 RepID=A0A6J8BXF6_MYTCO|nr:unnamed protein product [Mytilus coruscus]
MTDADLESFTKEQESKNTSIKTKSDLNIFKSYMKTKHNEKRNVDEIPPQELDRYLGFFFIISTKERQTNGTMEHEPTSLKSIQQSISRYLKDNNYQFNIMTDDEFYKSRQTLSAKSKNLKSLGLGNKSNAADPLTDDDINEFYSKNVMGPTSPCSIINTIYINNNYHFGLRGVTEHYNLCWGDITLKVDTNGDEYLQYCRERQTKTTFQDDKYGSKLLWYKGQRLGTKYISKIIKSMATESVHNNDKRLTGHSARKGSIQKQKDVGVRDTEIVQRTGT